MNRDQDLQLLSLAELEQFRQLRAALMWVSAGVVLEFLGMVGSAITGSLAADSRTLLGVGLLLVLSAVVVFFARRLPRHETLGCRDPENGRQGVLLDTVTVQGEGVPSHGRFRCEARALERVLSTEIGGRRAGVLAWDEGPVEAVDIETLQTFERLDRGRWPSKADRKRYALDTWTGPDLVMPGSDRNEERQRDSSLLSHLAGLGALFALAVLVLWLFIRSGRISVATGRPHAWDEPYSWFAALWLPAAVAMWQVGKWALKKLASASKRS